MRKLLTVLIAGTLMLGLVAPQAMALSREQRRAGRFQMYDGKRGWSHRDVARTIRYATDRWNVPYSKVVGIAVRESGLNERAVNASSGACGIFQHIPTYWPGRVAAYNRRAPRRMDVAPSCFNPRSNVFVSVKMMAAGGWSHWAATL